jgi:hypothetical protein
MEYYTFMLITWFWLAEKAWIKYTADRWSMKLRQKVCKNITTVNSRILGMTFSNVPLYCRHYLLLRVDCDVTNKRQLYVTCLQN